MSKKKQSQNPYIDMDTIRQADQRLVMKKIEQQGHCPFCPENLHLYHQKPILKDGQYWLLTDNQWPYNKVKHQLLAIYKTHIEHLKDVAPDAGKELFRFFGEIIEEREILGGGLAIRFGSNDKLGNYGSSVKHLHAHLIEPDLEALDQTEAWRLKFGQPKNYRKK